MLRKYRTPSLLPKALRSSVAPPPGGVPQCETGDHHPHCNPGDDAAVARVAVEHPARPPRARRRPQAEAQVEQPKDRTEVPAGEPIRYRGRINRRDTVEAKAERQQVARQQRDA